MDAEGAADPRGGKFPSDLTGLEAGEADNLDKTKEALDPLWKIADPVVQLYGTLSQCLFERTDARGREEFYGIAAFLLAAKRAACTGVLSVGRLHLQESNYFTRRCLELVGFSYHAWMDPKALHVWLHAGGGEAEYEAYKQKFSGKRLNEDLRQLDPRLPSIYERTNKLIHSSLFSISQSYELAKMTGGAELRIHMFDVQCPDQWSRAATELIAVLDTHLKATAALAGKILRGPAGREARKSWKRHHDPALGDFRRELDAGLRRTESRRSRAGSL